jgi:transposase
MAKKDDRSRCMGRSHGGPTTRIHALVDAKGRPIALKLTEGQAHDGHSSDDVLCALDPGRTLLGDRTYDSDEWWDRLAGQGAWPNVRPVPDSKNVPTSNSFLYRYRTPVERFFNKIRHFRAVAIRYDKHPANYLARVKLAAVSVWLLSHGSTT